MNKLLDSSSAGREGGFIAETRRTMTPRNGLPANGTISVVPVYALLFFDHLYSEWLALKATVDHPPIITVLEDLHEKRVHSHLTWSDIYTFDLALVDARPIESLIRKAYDARARYRSFAGQKEYDEYLASKPPDLTTILISPTVAAPTGDAEHHRPDGTASTLDQAAASADGETKSVMLVQRVLKADIKYLLSKFYLYYSMLPVREGLRDELTKRAVRRTLLFVAALVLLLVINLGGVLFFDIGESAAGLTVLTVALAGIMGGCVSMLQRIQSAPSEGDALFNLAALNNGWSGLSLSPLYGGIFASLLFVLFAGGVLQGSVFPVINTPKAPSGAGAGPTPPPSTPAPAQAAAASAPTAVPHDEAAADTHSVAVLRIRRFLNETGPVDGVAYALLIIWSFMAGFAERLVPDTLNRLVAKNEAVQGT
ncbi:MAG: hypothetical protein ABI818_13635 [Acidobacteriota bacterium]